MAQWLLTQWSVFSRATGIRKLFYLSTPLGIAGFYEILRLGIWINLPQLPVWEIAAFAALSLTLVWFFQRIKELEKKIEPNIEVTYAYEEPFFVINRTPSNERGRRYIRIKLRNTGTENIDNCLVVLEELTDKDGHSGFFTPVGMATQHQILQKRKGGPFHLRGGQYKFVNIASMDESLDNAEIEMMYETVTAEDEKMRYANGIKRELGPYSLKIAVFGGANPIYRKFKLFVGDDNTLRMESL